MCRLARIFTIAGCVACLLHPSVAAALPWQAPTAEVAGRVVDFDDTPLPGMAVELAGPFPENTRRTAEADEHARFVFRDLPPGRYRLALLLPDNSPRSNVDVTVRAGERVESTLVLSLQGNSLNVVVLAEVPAVAEADFADPESISGRRILAGTRIQNMPLPAEQVLEVLPLLPTVVRGPGGEIAIDGSMPTDSALLFNGIDLTDPYSGNFNFRLPIEAIDTVELQTGVAPASYGHQAGGIVDITTLPGGESWKWGIASFVPRPRFEDGTIQGIRAASPRVSVNGPLKSGEAYVSLAGEYHFDRHDVYDIPGDGSQDHVREQGWSAFGQLDWRPGDGHSFTFAGLAFPSYDKYIGLDGLTPPAATLNIERGAEAVMTRYRYREDDNRSLDVLVQHNRIESRSEAQGTNPYEVLTGGFDGNHFHGQERETTHTNGRIIWRRRFPGVTAGSHVLQLGGSFDRLVLNGEQTDGPILVRGADDRLVQRVDFARDSSLRADKVEWSFFAQDRWTRDPQFWADFGVRYSSDSYTGDHRFAPRLGAAWDPVGNRRTLIKGGAGIVYRRVYLGEMAWEQLPARLETTIQGDGTARLRSLVPRIEPGVLEAPHTVQFTGDFSHRLVSGWILRARYSRRTTNRNIVVDRTDGAGQVVDPELPAGTAAALLAANGRGGFLDLSNRGAVNAWSVEFTVARRIPTGGEFVFWYVRSSTFGDLNDFTLMTAEFPSAIIRPNERAKRRYDAPHRVLAWATLEGPKEIVITPTVEWRSGFPFSALAEDQSYFGAANSERFPTFFALDLQATKAFEIRGYRINLGAKIANLTGHDNPQQVVANVADARYLDYRNSVPVRVRLIFNLRF